MLRAGRIPRLTPASDPRFEKWLHAPVARGSADPRFEVLRARPERFEAIFDFVDDVFGEKRPRAEYDWLYRRNPNGLARCWITLEKASGRIVASNAGWPWRAALADRRRLASLSGDAAVARDLQRRGLPQVRRGVSRSHAMREKNLIFGWMNEKSVARARKWGSSGQVAGPLPRAVLYLKTRTRLARRGLPRALAALAGPAVDIRDALRRRARERARPLRVEDVSRFDERFESVADAALRWQGYWFPRDAAFLDWRYAGHPTHLYRSLALLRGERLIAWCVVRLDGARATLMEFAAPDDAALPSRLLEVAAAAAREAGCERLELFASPVWRGWSQLRAAPFIERVSPFRLYLRSGSAESSRLDEWQLLPGDHDRL